MACEDSTRIDIEDYSESLETDTRLIVYTEEHMHKVSVYFDIKRYLQIRIFSYSVNIDYFLW